MKLFKTKTLLSLLMSYVMACAIVLLRSKQHWAISLYWVTVMAEVFRQVNNGTYSAVTHRDKMIRYSLQLLSATMLLASVVTSSRRNSGSAPLVIASLALSVTSTAQVFLHGMSKRGPLAFYVLYNLIVGILNITIGAKAPIFCMVSVTISYLLGVIVYAYMSETIKYETTSNAIKELREKLIHAVGKSRFAKGRKFTA